MNKTFLKVLGISLAVIFAVFLAACPEESNNNNNNGNGENFEIAGTYNFTYTNVVHTWVFNTDKTFKISWVRQSERNYTGTWSVSGNEITLQLDDVMGVSIPSETFTASKNENKVTLTLKGNSPASTTFAIFSMAATSLTLTEGEGSSGGGINDFTFEDNGSSITITGYTGNGDAVDIPATINGKPVVSIGDSAFAENRLTSVTIPNSVTTIGKNAFAGNYYGTGNRLTSVTIPNSVTTIGDYAFSNNQLTSVTIGNSVTTIGSGAFAANRLTSVTIPNSVTTIGDSAFLRNQLTSVTIGNSVTTIGGSAFAENSLTSVTIPNSVTTIGSGAFSRNSLTSVTIGSSVTTIEQTAFQYNSLTSVIIPNSVTTIGDSAFSSNPLIRVTIGANVELGSFSFSGPYYNTFNYVYDNAGKAAGTYTRSDTIGNWTKQQN